MSLFAIDLLPARDAYLRFILEATADDDLDDESHPRDSRALGSDHFVENLAFVPTGRAARCRTANLAAGPRLQIEAARRQALVVRLLGTRCLRKALNPVATMEHIIVIGASAGGVETLRQVVSTLPGDLPCAVLITLHIGANKSEMPRLLSRAGVLPASHPFHGEPIQEGRIYVAPPDHHMLVQEGKVALTRGPRENWARPAIDPLFRSAATSYAKGAIGVILTGGLNDGTAGLFEIKAMGGTAVVQTPADAINAEMPQSAIDHVEVDYVRPASEIGYLLAELALRDAELHPAASVVLQQELDMSTEFTLERPVALTCPDCGGALQQRQSGALTQFVCHIGHGYTLEVMLAAQFVAMEHFLEQALRSLNERIELCRLMSRRREPDESVWISAQDEATTHASILRELLAREWLQPLADSPRRSANVYDGAVRDDQV